MLYLVLLIASKAPTPLSSVIFLGDLIPVYYIRVVRGREIVVILRSLKIFLDYGKVSSF